jgi:hypothetical protein
MLEAKVRVLLGFSVSREMTCWERDETVLVVGQRWRTDTGWEQGSSTRCFEGFRSLASSLGLW